MAFRSLFLKNCYSKLCSFKIVGMSQRLNEFGQPIGEDVPGWAAVAPPSRKSMEGRFCRLDALDTSRQAQDLFNAYSTDTKGGLWTYMPVGPFGTIRELEKWMEWACESSDPLFYSIIDQASSKAVGIASYLRITPLFGVIEVGNIAFSPIIQKTPIATEAMFLMMQRAFNELGYRRYEWKCDALNAPSRRAAERFGFTYDGLFEQALVYKGRNRDTAWYSIVDRDWPQIEAAFRQWLSPENFDGEGQQKRKLADLISGNR
jgi:RimJ/RimL family protein N-acetyltransferase